MKLWSINIKPIGTVPYWFIERVMGYNLLLNYNNFFILLSEVLHLNLQVLDNQTTFKLLCSLKIFSVEIIKLNFVQINTLTDSDFMRKIKS